MADEAKYIEHTITGSVPHEEWAKFLKQHFVPGGKAAPAKQAIANTMGGICGGLGCPATFHGHPLHSCSVDTEADGSTTIHCRYLVLAIHP